jgi:hypothetical protein
VTGITIIRINVLLHVDFTDLSYSMHDAAFWSVAEPAIAIINCCIATLRPLLSIISPSHLWSSNAQSEDHHTESSSDVKNKRPTRNELDIEHDEYPLTIVEGEITTTITRAQEESLVTTKSGKSGSNSAVSTEHILKA